MNRNKLVPKVLSPSVKQNALQLVSSLERYEPKIVKLTILIWCLITIIYAYLYVTTVLGFPDLQDYETEWRFQLLAFSIFRLPWVILVLAIVLGLEIRFLKK